MAGDPVARHGLGGGLGNLSDRPGARTGPGTWSTVMAVDPVAGRGPGRRPADDVWIRPYALPRPAHGSEDRWLPVRALRPGADARRPPASPRRRPLARC